MQIKREIDGRTILFQLSEEELFRAYQEQQRLFDRENIRQALWVQPDSELVVQYGLPLSGLIPLEDQMAASLRSSLNQGMSWDYALNSAIRSVAAQHQTTG